LKVEKRRKSMDIDDDSVNVSSLPPNNPY
jgi:hypothetical protein